MPHPGLVVATSPKFDGRLKGINHMLWNWQTLDFVVCSLL